MTTNSLLRVMATALLLAAACKSEFPAGSYADGGPKDADALPADQAPANDSPQNTDEASIGPTKPDGLDLTGLTALTVTTSGGMPGIQGDACNTDNKNVFTLVFQTRVLSWEHCAIDSNTAAAYRKAETQLLTDYEVTAAQLLLDLLSTDYDRTDCGADKPLETLDLTFADRVEHYQDDFYAGCPDYAPVDGRTYVRYMDLIASWLDELGRGSNPLPSSFLSVAVVSDLNPFPSSAAMTAATAACGTAVNPSYDVTAATRTISWSSCVSGSTGYGLRIGGRVLSEGEFARVMQSWSAIQLGATGDCSTPRSQKSLQLTTAPGVYSYLYLNDVTPCSRDTASAYSMYVVGLDDLAALLASLASGSLPSDGGALPVDSGPPTCRPPSPDYGPTSVFPILPNGTPKAVTTCSVACGISAWPLYGNTIDIALPYGACAPDTPPCSTIAAIPCACANAGRVDSFNCSCEGGTWICGILSLAAVICTPCPDAGVGNTDGGNDAAPVLRGDFASTGSMTEARYQHTATLLPSGKVLIAGGATTGPMGEMAIIYVTQGADLYDPAAGTFTATGAMAVARYQHAATLLPNGKVLITGGIGNWPQPWETASAELYDPATETFIVTGTMTGARARHTATLLPNGKVLIANGGSAELYDPAAGTFAAAGAMTSVGDPHTATLLGNGKVLIAGQAGAELYDPTSGTFTATGAMTVARSGHTATLLPSGKVLVTGGEVSYTPLASAELYDPIGGTFTATGAMSETRWSHTATLLQSGKVLIVGGGGATLGLTSAELYDPGAGTFTATGSLTVGRYDHTATLLLLGGKVLVAGGDQSPSGSLVSIVSAELYE
jgi:hypothetical protein